MPDVLRSTSTAGSKPARSVVAVLLLAGWLVGALGMTGSGTVLLAPFDPCGEGSTCAGSTIFVTEYALRYGPLLLFLATLPIAFTRLLQHRNPLPVIAVGLATVAVLILTTMLIAAIAG